MTDVKEFERFYTRDSFNKSFNHFNSVLSTIKQFEQYENIADILNISLQEGTIQQHQLLPILNALLVDKYEYSFKSLNLKETVTDYDRIFSVLEKWKGIDIVLGYHNPNIGFLVINPKRLESLQSSSELKRNELLVIYAGDYLGNKNKGNYGKEAIEEFIKLLFNKKYEASSKFINGKYVVKKIKEKSASVAPKTVKRGKRATGKSESVKRTVTPVQEQIAVQSGSVKMTPLYGVPVTNELFHNGNVEAWKLIIASYKMAYPGTDVIIFYDGERIHDINTLFKWGKVKHGSSIMFAISGKDEFKDVAKLNRYLRQGASPRFIDFLQFPINTIPKLF